MKRDYTAEKINEVDENIYTFSVASDTPYKRTTSDGKEYWEVLVISEDAIIFDRLKDERCPMIYEHDTDKQLGVVEKAYISGNKLYVDVKFSSSDFAQGVLKDIVSGVRRNVSVGYTIEKYEMISTKDDNIPTMLCTKWMPYEVTSCSCPADVEVGYNRSLIIKENKMKKEEITQENADGSKIEAEVIPVEVAGEAGVEEVEETVKEEVKTCGKTCGKKEAKAEEISEIVSGQVEAPDETKECGECINDAEEITSLGELTGNEELAKQYIGCKKSYNEFKKAIRALKENTKKDINVNKGKKSMEKFSLRKAIANVMGEISNEDASFERSIIAENQRKYGSNAAIVVTKENLRKFPDGSEALNQATYRPDQYTENLRPQNVIEKTGARVVSVDGTDISFGVCTSGLNAGFVDLNGDIPSADMAWELKTMQPKKLGCYVTVSKKALLQDRPDIEDIILNDITKALDQCKDEAAICGDGTSNKPTGIYNTSGINTVTLPSGDWTLSTALAFEKPIRDSNDFSEGLSWVMNSNMYYKLAATPKSAVEQNDFLINDKREMIGYPCYICNALPTSGIILGNFDELLVAEFNAMEVSVESDATLSRKQAREVQAFEAVDVLVRRKKSFTKGA